LDGTVVPAEYCENYLCSQGNYTQLVDCVNCIVANGDERPQGYHTNTALTAAPTAPPANGLPFNPLGLVDEEQANGWLRNVTERCSSVDRPVTGGDSVTATPTTTYVHLDTIPCRIADFTEVHITLRSNREILRHYQPGPD
jgi:hypothetical protein